MKQSWVAVTRRAEERYGVITRAECIERGMSEDAVRRAVRDGRLVEPLPRVYRLPGAPITRVQQLYVAAVWAGRDNAVSHGSAAEVLRLDGFPLGAIDNERHVTLQRGHRLHHAVVAHRTTVLPGHHRTFVDGIGCTSAALAVVDLAATLDEEALTAAAESARRMGIMSIAELVRGMRDLDTRRTGIARLRRYVEANRGQPALQYLLEVKLAKLLRDPKLPPFLRQQRVAGTPYRLDFAPPELLLAVDAVGFRWHDNVLQWKQDHRRVATLERLGWRVLFVDWDDVTARGDETIARVALAIRERSAAA